MYIQRMGSTNVRLRLCGQRVDVHGIQMKPNQCKPKGQEKESATQHLPYRYLLQCHIPQEFIGWLRNRGCPINVLVMATDAPAPRPIPIVIPPPSTRCPF